MHEGDIADLRARVSNNESEINRLRRRLHDLSNQLAELKATAELHRVGIWPLPPATGKEGGDNWPITVRHVLIAVGSATATIGVLKLVGLLH